MKSTKHDVWTTDSGIELIRLDKYRTAEILAARLSPESLEELAEACVEAAAALRDRSLASTSKDDAVRQTMS